MGTFRYANPLTVNYGSGSIATLAEALASCPEGPIFVVTTNSLLGSNALGLLLGASDRLGATDVVTVTSHVPIEQVHAITLRMRETGAAAVVALGGGSAIDAAKLCGYAAGALPGAMPTLDEFKALVATPSLKALPIFCVPTTLAAAELYAGAGFTDEVSGQKDGAYDPAMIPDLVIYDPRVSADTPSWLWLATGMRALDHAIETLVATGVDPISEALSMSAARDLFDTLPRYAADPTSESVRLAGFIAAWKSYHLPAAAAKGLSHTVGKAVGARNGIAHGITSSVILPRMVRYYADHAETAPAIQRLGEFLGLPADRYALADALERLATGIGLPTRFTAEQFSAEAAHEAAVRSAAQTGLTVDVVEQILLDCREETAAA